MTTKKELKKLALNDLKRSGLMESDFKKMKLTVCSEEEAKAVLNSSFSTLGYILPYFDTKGNQLDNIRFRFLDILKNDKNKIVKYSQPKGTEPKLYFPPCIKWNNILKDSSITITFTEGEKKAYTACKKGIPTIGLGGVWSFKSKKLQKNLIDDFKNIILSDRKILICYDNDIHSNVEVLKALRAFAKELNNQGAIVFNKILPFNPYQKIGIDDYLLTNSVKDFENLLEEEFEDLIELSELDSEIAYISDIGKIYIPESNLFTSEGALVRLIYSNRLMPSENGFISVASQWLTWPKRRTFKRLTYKPAQPQVTNDNEYNLWKGWGAIPEKGSVKLFINAVKQIFNNDDKLITWFLDWVAYPIQHPATKMLTAVLIQSIDQGTGKSSLGLCIGAMYGENYKLVDDAQLSMSFNEWAINKQFILGDEVSGKDKRGEADKIKNLITRPEITINKKHAPTYSIPDCINYFFTSNHPDPLNIEPDDRRLFVHEIQSGNGLSLKQGKALEIFRNGKGTSHLLHYFINEYKISKDFDHRARPPMTTSKMELIDHSLTDIERFLTDIRENPEQGLAINGVSIDRDLFTTAQVVHLYERLYPKSNVTNTAMGKALKKIFSNSVMRSIRTLNGTQRLRALRNINKWNKASIKDISDHYDRSKIAMLGVNKKSKIAK